MREDKHLFVCRSVIINLSQRFVFRSYYGYHNSEEGFFKIHFYTPFSLTKAAQLLAVSCQVQQISWFKRFCFVMHVSWTEWFHYGFADAAS